MGYKIFVTLLFSLRWSYSYLRPLSIIRSSKLHVLLVTKPPVAAPADISAAVKFNYLLCSPLKITFFNPYMSSLGKYLYPLDQFEALLVSKGFLRTKIFYSEDDLSTPPNMRNLCSKRDFQLSTGLSGSVPIFEKAQFLDEYFVHHPDLFYCSEGFESLLRDRKFDPADDLFFTYEKFYEANSAISQNILQKINKVKSGLFEQSVKRNYEAFHLWEQHDSITKREISSLDVRDLEEFGNGGVYPPRLPKLHSSKLEGVSQMLEIAPANKFRDLIEMDCQNVGKLNGLSSSLRYKNNLSALVRTNNNIEYLLICCQSDILIFEFDKEMHIPKTDPILTINTRPLVTSTSDRISLTWPFFPHTLNSIKSYPDWVNGDVVVACSDDGRVLIWNVESLITCIQKLISKPKNPRYTIRIECDHSLNLGSSTWGIDVKTAVDIHGKKHHILAASANNKRVTLFYYHETLHQFSRIETHSVLHNIPEVSFINYIIRGADHYAILTCGTISGELITFKFEFKLDECQAVNLSSSQNIKYKPPIVTRRTCLGADCWTSKPINAKFFKKVQSLRAMTGNHSIDEEARTSRVLNESRIFSPAVKPSLSSDLGVASRWQFFETPVFNFASQTGPSTVTSSVKFCSFQEECRRMFHLVKDLFNDDSDSDGSALRDIFLAVSTDTRLALFRADTLLCSAASKAPFDFSFSTDDENKWCNRILISVLVPELLAYIAVTQLGLVTIMRLCEHRGVYGMRQEHLFPNAKEVCASEDGLRTIIGISVRNLSPLEFLCRFFLYVIYSDGLILTYQLRSCASDEEFC